MSRAMAIAEQRSATASNPVPREVSPFAAALAEHRSALSGLLQDWAARQEALVLDALRAHSATTAAAAASATAAAATASASAAATELDLDGHWRTSRDTLQIVSGSHVSGTDGHWLRLSLPTSDQKGCTLLDHDGHAACTGSVGAGGDELFWEDGDVWRREEPKFFKHSGFISDGGDLLMEKMTVRQAKRKATTLPGCRGFCFWGEETDKAVDVIFKNHFDINSGWFSWTSFNVEQGRGHTPHRGMQLTLLDGRSGNPDVPAAAKTPQTSPRTRTGKLRQFLRTSPRGGGPPSHILGECPSGHEQRAPPAPSPQSSRQRWDDMAQAVETVEAEDSRTDSLLSRTGSAGHATHLQL